MTGRPFCFLSSWNSEGIEVRVAPPMDEEKREARRKMLAELERAWDDTPKPVTELADRSVQPPTVEMQAALDAAADRLVESLDPPPVSVPSMDDLDSGWGAEQDEEDDEEEEQPESEPELPDEKLDPVAYAAAKQARDDRASALRERRRVKVEAKKARRKARLDAQKSKQKAKTKKARPPAVVRTAKEQKAAARAEAVKQAKQARKKQATAPDADEASGDDDAIEAAGVPSQRAKAPPSRLVAKKSMLSGTNTWMLGIALAIFIAAAIFVAVITR